MNCSFKIDFKKMGLFALATVSLALAVICNFYFIFYSLKGFAESYGYGAGCSGLMILYAVLFAGFVVSFVYFVHKLTHYVPTSTCCCAKKNEIKAEPKVEVVENSASNTTEETIN